ncbi:MAG: site-specific integrase [Paramuribaculum sp.]|nr:site-specific integrase [Paramuribaculum sp.]
MFSYKFFSDPSRKDDVRLRLTNNRKKVEISLGLRISQADIDNALSPSPLTRNVKWRNLLLNYQAKIDDIKCELLKTGRVDEDVRVIKDMVVRECFGTNSEEDNDPEGGNFIKCFRDYISRLDNKSTIEVYTHTLKRILSFDLNIEEKNFEDINLRWLTEFDAALADNGNSKNTRGIHLRNIRAVFNNAIDFEITNAYPFRRFKVRPEETRKRSMSVEELRKLFSYPVEPYAQIYQDMFKLIFMLIGINTVDLHRLQEITKDGRIEYKRAKTGRLYSIKVEPEAFELINKYKGEKGLLCVADRWSDHRNFRHQLNKALQRIGEVERIGRGGKKIVTSEFPEVSSYWARHTWATIAYSIGISKDVIAQALGHSDGHSTTNIYIKEDVSKVDEANRRVLDWVLYGKQ